VNSHHFHYSDLTFTPYSSYNRLYQGIFRAYSTNNDSSKETIYMWLKRKAVEVFENDKLCFSLGLTGICGILIIFTLYGL